MSPHELEGLASIIDGKALMARCLNNFDFVERILTLFQDRCEVELTELDRAFEAGDLDAVRRIAHRLSGSCANAAATGLQKRAADLRHSLDESEMPRAEECIAELRAEWNRFSRAMAADRSTPLAIPQ